MLVADAETKAELNRSEEMVKHLRKSRDEEEARYESEKSAMKEQHEVADSPMSQTAPTRCVGWDAADVE